MFDKKNKGSALSASLILVLVAVITFISARSYLNMRSPDPEVDRVVPAAGFVKHRLSEWSTGIKDTPADTDVYIQDGNTPGGTALVLGGTHNNEPAAAVAAVVLLENARVKQGRLIIVPYANMMGRSHTYPQDAHPQFFHFEKEDGTKRIFRFGSRISNPIYGWPSPDIYVHPASGQTMAGSESLNLNRTHPGSPTGTLTEKLSWAYLQLIKKEKIDLAVDLHEASPEYPVVYAMVAHERAMELAAIVTMDLETEGIPMRLEPSPTKLHGLTHREWGDHTDTLAILMETGNPSMGRFRGKTDEKLILTGEDKAYRKAFELGQLYIPYEDGTEPIRERVARHVAAVEDMILNLGMVREDADMEVSGLPGYNDLLEKGVAPYLHD